MPAIPVHVGGPGSPGRPILSAPRADGAAVVTTLGGIQQTRSTIPDGAQPTRPSEIVTLPSILATVFNDSGSGTITLSGSGVESFSTPPRKPLVAVLQPPAVEARLVSRSYAVSVPSTTFNDSGSGTITLSGSGVESFSTPPRTALEAVNQPVTELARLSSRIYTAAAPAQTFNDSGTGTITFSGSGVESFSTPGFVVQAASGKGSTKAVAAYEPPGLQPKSIDLQGFVGVEAPPPPGVSFPVALQGQSNSFVTSQVPQPVDQNYRGPVPQVFVFYNAAPPIYHGIVAGGTNQSYTMPVVPQLAIETQAPPRIVRVPASAAITYTDSGSGTLVLSGSGTETFTTPPWKQPLRGVVQSTPIEGRLGARVVFVRGAVLYTDSGSGTITLSGSGFDNYQPPGGAGAPQEDPNHYILLHA